MITKFNRILFDYDGTLLIHDTETQCIQMARILNVKPELEQEFSSRLKNFFNSSFTRQYFKGKRITYDLYYNVLELFMTPISDFGITAKDITEAMREKSKYDAHLAEGAIETLEYLKAKGYKLCVLTNGFYAGQIENMKYHKVYDYFEQVYAWDKFYAKPDLRAFYRALGTSKIENNVMIGDDLQNDIVPAKEIGLYTIGINIPKDVISQPDKSISKLSELKNIL